MKAWPRVPSGLVSAVVPARNAAATIARTLRSLAPDAAMLREIILVDDGSTDNTVATAKAAASKYRLPLAAHSVQAGSVGAARNAGMSIAKGDYVYFIDADDEQLSGGLIRLLSSLENDASAGMAVGANIRHTAGRPDLLKSPKRWTSNRLENARLYLRNEIWPVAMGSALVRRSAVEGICFPAGAGLDEDTVFWAAVIASSNVVTVAEPVLLYHHDERRMSARFVDQPHRMLEDVHAALDTLNQHGIPAEMIRWRQAWVARRMARQLLMSGQFAEASWFLQQAAKDKEFARSWKHFFYKVRIAAAKSGIVKADADRKVAASVSPKTAKRFVIVSYDPVWPPVSGYDCRVWRLAQSLARFGQVTLASVRDHGDAKPNSDGITMRSIAPGTAPADRTALTRTRTAIEPRICQGTFRKLAQLTKELEPDFTVISGAPLCRLMTAAEPFSKKLVLDMHNVESDLLAQKGKRRSLVRRMLLRLSVVRARRAEKAAVSMADIVCTCSRQDRDRLINGFGSGAEIIVVPNTAPRPAFPPILPEDASADPVILFVGHLGYWPNVEAAERLAAKILPIIQKRLPSVRLVLAGRSPKPSVLALTRFTGVEVIADPADMKPFYRTASIAMAPLMSGGGTRIKILEAMALGVPVIATGLAAEGLDMAEDIDFLKGETDKELADAATRLLENPAIGEALRDHARIRVEASFGDDALNDAVQELVRRL